MNVSYYTFSSLFSLFLFHSVILSYHCPPPPNLPLLGRCKEYGTHVFIWFIIWTKEKDPKLRVSMHVTISYSLLRLLTHKKTLTEASCMISTSLDSYLNIMYVTWKIVLLLVCFLNNSIIISISISNSLKLFNKAHSEISVVYETNSFEKSNDTHTKHSICCI